MTTSFVRGGGLYVLGDPADGMSAKYSQVRLVSTKAERPNHPSRGGGDSQPEGVSQGGGVLHDNDNDADVTP